ncbi:MAG TPA: inositol monophosphatase [Gaiellaceae bacterium]|nr:inositol monophosphatase [Gaiellaceae bacterium]
MLTDSDLDACAALLAELATAATERILVRRPEPHEIATKSSVADWVTETDLAVERHVRAAVLERFPDHRVVGEEYGTSGSEAPAATWYVDPVDGTTNFVHGLPWSSFSLAVVDDAGPAAAAVVDPYRGECLSAVRGRGAFVDAKPVRCSEATTLTGGIVLTELAAQSLWPGLAELMARLAATGCVTRIMGSNALALAGVGAGRAAATVLGAFGAVDCIAGTLIAREAGATVRSRSGAAWPQPGEGFFCAAPGVADELATMWSGVEDGARA